MNPKSQILKINSKSRKSLGSWGVWDLLATFIASVPDCSVSWNFSRFIVTSLGLTCINSVGVNISSEFYGPIISRFLAKDREIHSLKDQIEEKESEIRKHAMDKERWHEKELRLAKEKSELEVSLTRYD